MPVTRIDTVFSPTFSRVKGKDAWSRSLQLVTFACDKIQSTLGPKGAYKMITYNVGPERVTKITKDAVQVMEELAIQNPLLTVVAEAAKMQREETGDGVNTFVILLSGLLSKADELVALGVHRNIIVNGYLRATKKALEVIDADARDIDEGKLADLLDTVDCGNGVSTTKFRNFVLEACELASRDGKVDKNKVRVVKKLGGEISDSKLIKGLIVKKEKAHPNMPDRIDSPRIAIISGETSMKRLETKMPGEGRFPIKLDIKNSEQMEKYREAENQFRTKFLNKIKSVHANVVCSQQPLDEKIRYTFARLGIFALENLTKEDIVALGEAAGARVSPNLQELSEQDVGHAESLEVEKSGLERMVKFNGCKAATFLLKGTTTQALDELEETVRRSVLYLKTAYEDKRVLPGGGAAEMQIAQELNTFAKHFPSREQMAIQAFADALTRIPRCLAENNGLNSTDTTVEMKTHHANGFSSLGVGLEGCSESICWELAKAKIAVIRRAYEVASLFLRIDEQIVSSEIAKFHKK